MRKKYIKPEIEIVEMQLEGVILTESAVKSETEVADQDGVLSNKERNGGLWDDISFD